MHSAGGTVEVHHVCAVYFHAILHNECAQVGMLAKLLIVMPELELGSYML